MAAQHAAALGAGAACVGAALAAKVAVLGLVQILSVALEDDEPEDQTEAEWATDRYLLKRCRQAAHQASTASGGSEGGSGIARSLIMGVLNLYRGPDSRSIISATEVQPYHA
jgi:hypothetical protein